MELAFRYSKDAVDVKALRRYAAGRTIEIRSTARDVIVAISVESDGDSFDTADDGSGWLSSLIGLRADLASGDERILYLGWLLDVQSGEIDDDAVEPTRPEGLGALTPALESFIDIVGIDRDLVAASADGAPKTASRLPAREVHRWPAMLDTTEHLTMLARVARGDTRVGAEIMHRFRQHTRSRAALPLRAAGVLRARARAIAERRRKKAREHQARERAAREREEQAARDRYLTRLVKQERQAWLRVDSLMGADVRPTTPPPWRCWWTYATRAGGRIATPNLVGASVRFEKRTRKSQPYSSVSERLNSKRHTRSRSLSVRRSCFWCSTERTVRCHLLIVCQRVSFVSQCCQADPIASRELIEMTRLRTIRLTQRTWLCPRGERSKIVGTASNCWIVR